MDVQVLVYCINKGLGSTNNQNYSKLKKAKSQVARAVCMHCLEGVEWVNVWNTCEINFAMLDTNVQWTE